MLLVVLLLLLLQFPRAVSCSRAVLSSCARSSRPEVPKLVFRLTTSFAPSASHNIFVPSSRLLQAVATSSTE
uniref:Putative secreted protein n=1 Tax=Anopheles triannulatus TaxID=58253 RepID=A0A2M4B7Q6_9DIPT